MPPTSDSTLAAIKQSTDIVSLIGEYLPLRRVGSKYKTLCPFHDDHNPSLEVSPERQSYKCWSCGAGGDVLDFVQEYERVDFQEALRMLAERAGVELDARPNIGAARRVDKTTMLQVLNWASEEFAQALQSPAGLESRAYLTGRGLSEEMIQVFRLGHAPIERDWLTYRAKRAGWSSDLLEQVGLLARPDDPAAPLRERFRGRLLFPIHDFTGRVVGFGGRILPGRAEQLQAAGRGVAKYVNSPETTLFQKRRLLYGSHLARASARAAGWVAVMEGYTDVIAARQVGITNVVGTLGTAFGDDHVLALRRLADQVILVFDGDEAGQNAAEKSLEFLLKHDLDARVLSLPMGQDPCDFLLSRGADDFTRLVQSAVDPIEFTMSRVSRRFGLSTGSGGSIEQRRQAAEAVLSLMAAAPARGLEATKQAFKLNQALLAISSRLQVPVALLNTWRRELMAQSERRASVSSGVASAVEAGTPATGARQIGGSASSAETATAPRIDVGRLDRLDRELVQLALTEPSVVAEYLAGRIPASSLRDPALRIMLQAIYDVVAQSAVPTPDRVSARLSDPSVRRLMSDLLLPLDRHPMPQARPAPIDTRLQGILSAWADRERHERLSDVEATLREMDPTASPDDYRALRMERLRLLNLRSDLRVPTRRSSVGGCSDG